MELRTVIAGAVAALAVGVGGVLAVSASSAAEQVAAPVTVPVGHYSTVEAASLATMSEDDFLVTIKGLLSGRPHANQSDAQYVQGGKDICANIASGSTMSTFLEQVDQINGDAAFYRAAIRASVYTYCPDSTGILYR